MKVDPDGPLAPRKRPQQERSSARVEAILAAALRLLNERGPQSLTTRTIAARAELPIGSIYQYFPNKEAIVAALAGRWMSFFQEVMEAQLREAPPRTWPAFCRRFHAIHESCSANYLRHRDLLCVINSIQVDPELTRIEANHDRAMIRMMARWLLAVQAKLSARTAMRLCKSWLNTAHANLADAAVNDPGTFAAVVGDSETMVLALLRPYLFPSVPRARGAASRRTNRHAILRPFS
jgi:AcrR family transcriptional regulator